MTQAELDALPETGGFDRVEKIIDGKRVIVPVMRKAFALFHKDDEPIQVTSSDGTRYMIGWANGIRYKARLPSR